jgi:hypothetical protein
MSLLWVLSSRAWQYKVFSSGWLSYEVDWERPSCFLWLPNAAAASARVFKGRRAPGHLVGGVSAERFLFFLPGEAFFTPTGKLLSASGRENRCACTMTYSGREEERAPSIYRASSFGAQRRWRGCAVPKLS